MPERPPEQSLALAYAAGELREAFAVLLQLDRILGRSVALAREPVLGQVRLAWWREQFAALPSVPTGNDPLLGAVHGLTHNHPIDQGDLAALVNGWETLLDEFSPSDSQLIAHARGRGGAIFRLASAISASPVTEETERAGTLWALADLARHCSDRDMAGRALAFATEYIGSARLLPRALRPFAILTRFAERDAAAGLDRLTPVGSPRRIVQALAFVAGLP